MSSPQPLMERPPGFSGAAVSVPLDLAALAREELAPLAPRIDREGLYPESVLRAAGAAGAFRHHLASQNPAGVTDLAAAVDAMAVLSAECMSTGFAAWCQDACAWYVENSDNAALKRDVLPALARGELLGGTGLSNPMKHFSGIEQLKLSARPVDGGFVVNGMLPWVSNLGADHYFAAIFQVEGADGHAVMALIHCADEGFSLEPCKEFTALEGTRTFGCRFQNVFVPHERVLADPVAPFIRRIRSGFILLQMGMGLGVVEGCIRDIRESGQSLAHVNCYLDVQAEDLEVAVQDARDALRVLADTPLDESREYFREVLQLRLAGSELALKASQAAMLHAGARGYLAHSPAQRRLRESYFVAIVTPAIKHIRKELAKLEAA